MVEDVTKIADVIAKKSPVAVQGTKMSMVYSRDHTVQEGLDHVVSKKQAQFSITLYYKKSYSYWIRPSPSCESLNLKII